MWLDIFHGASHTDLILELPALGSDPLAAHLKHIIAHAAYLRAQSHPAMPNSAASPRYSTEAGAVNVNSETVASPLTPAVTTPVLAQVAPCFMVPDPLIEALAAGNLVLPAPPRAPRHKSRRHSRSHSFSSASGAGTTLIPAAPVSTTVPVAVTVPVDSPALREPYVRHVWLSDEALKACKVAPKTVPEWVAQLARAVNPF